MAFPMVQARSPSQCAFMAVLTLLLGEEGRARGRGGEGEGEGGGVVGEEVGEGEKRGRGGVVGGRERIEGE